MANADEFSPSALLHTSASNGVGAAKNRVWDNPLVELLGRYSCLVQLGAWETGLDNIETNGNGSVLMSFFFFF